MLRIPSLMIAGLVLALVPPLLAQAAERTQEAQNRELVVNFYNQFFNAHETERSTEVLADNYIQHNPGVPDGKAAFVDYFTDYFREHPDDRSEIERSAADGDLVWLHVHASHGENDRGEAVVDIFRVEHGLIVEHWDVIQPVPAESANDNTMF
ncbi:hypothetical protein GY26_13615 [Gammaproteobacteria bacterium MFB021]|nr:hypothetical protein GY26_13615 [Gammaproteobacteria bacterium MFB021]